jgi:hypothetical protein
MAMRKRGKIGANEWAKNILPLALNMARQQEEKS